MRKSEEESPEDICNEPEELSEEPSYESFSQQSSESENEEIEHPSEELEEEPDDNPSEDSLSQPVSETETDDNKCHSESVSNSSKEKKWSLDVTAGDSGSLQVHPTQKKCKQEECLKPEPDTGSALKDLHKESGSPKAFVNAENASEQQSCTGSSGKRRRSRWDLQPKVDREEGEGDRTSKRRKTRWADEDSQSKLLGPIQLPNFIKDIVAGADSDPEIQELEMKLLEINRKLQGSEIHDKLGIKMNSRDVRYREKLVQDRHTIISKLIQKSPVFKPPSDFKPSNLCKKVYIPVKEYPGHNLIGLIIGPRGNTQKRMEKETGATIKIRGKGSSKSKRTRQKSDASFSDDLHVLVEADNQRSLDEAVRMVEELLNPVDERTNRHKHAQLKELAVLKGMVRDESLCKECGGRGHKQYACPNRKSTFEIDSCDICGGSSHPTSNCPLTASTPVSNIRSQCHSVAHIGSGSLSFGNSTVSRSMPQGCSNCGLFTSPSCGHFSHPGVSASPNTEGKCSKEANDGNLYVGNLPQTMDDNQLRKLFFSFGKITDAKVIKDRSTGFSKGYGFVTYENPTDASAAVAHMQGQRIDGKPLVVRVGRRPANVGSMGISLLPKFTGPSPVSQGSRRPTAWPGPPGSMLPEFQDTFP
ncbi:splicing factor-like protein 1 isoform X2 [Telopea speciosissima]|uniref:splicing factor-like protein 1 isoform X1 n=1 Tax=Telopea speciosissima TaxID=54955 RepID=UPI001CC3511F|nr:splicing factor-like protein 1 isoform X1 [Telopea speciosissima]XP_043715109.1 splicing factor-like protein 1 isoform X2 [Telopea speciosissima]